MTADNIRRATLMIDAHFNSLLYDGMDPHEAWIVQEERRKAHAELQAEIMRRTLAGYAPLGRH